MARLILYVRHDVNFLAGKFAVLGTNSTRGLTTQLDHSQSLPVVQPPSRQGSFAEVVGISLHAAALPHIAELRPLEITVWTLCHDQEVWGPFRKFSSSYPRGQGERCTTCRLTCGHNCHVGESRVAKDHMVHLRPSMVYRAVACLTRGRFLLGTIFDQNVSESRRRHTLQTGAIFTPDTEIVIRDYLWACRPRVGPARAKDDFDCQVFFSLLPLVQSRQHRFPSGCCSIAGGWRVKLPPRRRELPT